MSEKDFKFYVPVDLIKADKADEDAEDSWQIQGIASTGDLDYQGETVDQSGLDISFLKAGKGSFNHDHKPGPNNVLGAIDDAEFVNYNGAQALMVKGYLFKHQDLARGYYGIMKSLRKGAAPRVHFSIEGKILERDKNDVSTIRKAKITKVALTEFPVNSNTYASLIKSLSALDEVFAVTEEIEKAMEAGIGGTKAPTDRVGGEALVSESLDSNVKSVGEKNSKKKKKITEQVIKSTIAILVAKHPEANPLDLARLVCTSFENKMKEST